MMGCKPDTALTIFQAGLCVKPTNNGPKLVEFIAVCFGIALALELVSKELNHLAAILQVYAGGLNFIK